MWLHLITAEQAITAARYIVVTAIKHRIMPVKAIWVDSDITMAVTGTRIGTVVIALTQGNRVITAMSAADIIIPDAGIGAAAIRAVIAVDITTGDEKNNSGLRWKSAMSRI